MTLFKIDRETCVKDGICASVCPVRIINFKNRDWPEPIKKGEKLCLECGHCVAACPSGSLSHREMSPEDCAPGRDDFKLSVDDCEYFLRSRRSVRIYKNKPVSKKDLARLIDIAAHAPSGHNTQCVEWLVLGGRERLSKLSAITADWMVWMLENMPEVALGIHMDKALKRWQGGYDVFLRHAPVLIVAHADKDNGHASQASVIALSYLELAASSMGLGTCWAGYFNAAANAFPALGEELGLPENHRAFGSMMAGWPKFKYHRLPSRRKPSVSWRLEQDGSPSKQA